MLAAGQKRLANRVNMLYSISVLNDARRYILRASQEDAYEH